MARQTDVLPPGNITHASEAGDDEHQRLALGRARGHYRFDRYKTVSKPAARLVVEPGHKERLEALAGSMFWVRDLVNTPAMDMGPAELAAEAQRLAKQHNAHCRGSDGDERATALTAMP